MDYQRKGSTLVQKATILEQGEQEKRRAARILERENYTPQAIRNVFMQQAGVMQQSSSRGHKDDDPTNSQSMMQQIQYEFQETVNDLQNAAFHVLDGLSELNPLDDERVRMKTSVKICANALISLKLHAAVKLQHLQLKVVSLQHELETVQGNLSKLTITNESLNRQLMELTNNENDGGETPGAGLRSVDLKAEEHLNSLLLSRSQVLQENTNLKKMLLHTCKSCRERLPLRKAAQKYPSALVSEEVSLDEKSSPAPTQQSTNSSSAVAPSEKARPTWQASTKHVLNKLKSQVSLEKDESSTPEKRSSEPPSNHIQPPRASLVGPPSTRQNPNLSAKPSPVKGQAQNQTNGRIPNEATGYTQQGPATDRNRQGQSNRSNVAERPPPPPPSVVESSLNDLTSFLFPPTKR